MLIDETLVRIRSLITDVPDFPSPGILFRDITPLLADPAAFAAATDLLAERVERHAADGLIAIESRGFILGAAVAQRMRLPLALVRKPGKLPRRTVSVSYQLEYGSDSVHMHADALRAGGRYALIDDLLATGGTAAAACALVRELQAEVACCTVLIELRELRGREKLAGVPVESLIGL